MKFKVGDKVRIKENLKERNDYKYYVHSNMQNLAGKIVTIESVREESYKIEQDNGYWDWTEDMFEEIKKPTKEELLKMPKGTKVITDKKENNEFIFDGCDDFENEKGDFFWNIDVNEDLSLDDKDYGTKIIEIQTQKYETCWKEYYQNKPEENNLLILTHIEDNNVKVRNINLNELPEDQKEKIIKELEDLLK